MSRWIRFSGRRISGQITVPGDKSISHRAAMLASVASGTSVLRGFATSGDCHATLRCLRKLGVEIRETQNALLVEGRGLSGYSPESDPVHLFAGNSGSTIRMLSGLLAGNSFTSIIDGDSSLRRRPMARILQPLQLMGAQLHARDGNFAPLRLSGGDLRPIQYVCPIASAQVKTCVLLAALHAEGNTSVREPKRTRNHTELMLKEFGVPVKIEASGFGTGISLQGRSSLVPVNYSVPGDPSSAAFFAAAATLLPDSNLTILNVNLNRHRTAFFEVLNQLGARITEQNVIERHGEPVGDLVVQGATLRSRSPETLLAGETIPALIDELPMLAVVGAQLNGKLVVRGAEELRFKESDRLRTIVDGIRSLGGEIEEFDDGFEVEGPQQLRGARVETAGDHRIAMAFSIAALIAEGASEISDADCVEVSFPEFFDLLSQVCGDELIAAG